MAIHQQIRAAVLLLRLDAGGRCLSSRCMCMFAWHGSSLRQMLTQARVQDAQMLHMSYHDGEHYNSVRLKGDLQDQIPQPVPAACCNAFSGTPLQEGDEQAADDDKIRQVLPRLLLSPGSASASASASASHSHPLS